MKTLVFTTILLLLLPAELTGQRLRKTKRKIERKVEKKRSEERTQQNNPANHGRPSTGIIYVPPIYNSNTYWSIRDYRNKFDRYSNIYVDDQRGLNYDDGTESELNFGAEFNEYPYAGNNRWFVESGYKSHTELSYSYGFNKNDNITLSNFYLESTLGLIGLSLDYFSLKETFRDTTTNMDFYNISLFYMMKLEMFQSAVYLYIGGNLLDMYEKPAYYADRKYGGFHYGVKFKSFFPKNISVYLSAALNTYKDRIDEDQNIFEVSIYQLKLSYHIDRYALNAGLKLERFTEFKENFIQQQFGLSIFL